MIRRKATFTGVIRSLPFTYNDGGRAAAGFKGKAAGDCVCRAFVIASGRSYQEVYDLINEMAAGERTGKRKRGISSARAGVYKVTTRQIAERLGATWVPTMAVGSGCKVHLRAGEIPNGRIVASVTRHVCAVIDGVIHDTHDPSRGGTRCVYGYFVFEEASG